MGHWQNRVVCNLLTLKIEVCYIHHMVRVSIDGETYEFKSGRIADMIRAVIINRYEVASGNKTLHLECNGKQIKPKVTITLDTIVTTE